MPSSRHEEYREFVRHWVSSRRHEPYVVAALARQAEALRVLWELDLEPARPVLQQGYAQNPRGAKVRDPVIVLRALLLSLLVGQPKINKWVRDLKASRVLQVVCGLGLDGFDGVPGVFRPALEPVARWPSPITISCTDCITAQSGGRVCI